MHRLRLSSIHGATSARWSILGLLTGLSLISYMERMNISVAAKLIMPEFALTELQMGQIFSSFMLGYALFQIPMGAIGDRWGPRCVLAVAAFSWGAITLLTGFVPGVLTTTELGVFYSFLLLRFLLGVAEAATYPVAARAIANWIPAAKRALSVAMLTTGLSAGAMITPPLVSWLMVSIGWRGAFYITSAPAFLIAIVWWLFASDHPEQPAEVSEKSFAPATIRKVELAVVADSSNSLLTLFKNRNLCLISLSYFCEGYMLFMFVFWFYIYLVEVRGFSILSGGFFTSFPFLISAILAPIGGYLSDLLSIRIGPQSGRKIIVITGFTLSAGLLLYGANVNNPYSAVFTLSLSVGCLQFTQGAFWSSAIDVAGSQAGAACGLMNMASNLGGVVSTALLPVLVSRVGWSVALGASSTVAVLGALIWLGIELQRGSNSFTPELVSSKP